MTQGTFIWPDQVTGTTLAARQFRVYVNNAAPATTLSAVSVKFAQDGAVTLTPTVTINSAANWTFTVGPVAASGMGLAEGVHEFDIKTTDSAGTIEKYVRGTLTVLPSPQ